MSGSKTTTMTRSDMRAAARRGESQTDWARVRREVSGDPAAAEENRKIGSLLARKRGRPVEGEPKISISLRVPVSVLEGFKATGSGWQTRMNAALKDWLKSHPPRL